MRYNVVVSDWNDRQVRVARMVDESAEIPASGRIDTSGDRRWVSADAGMFSQDEDVVGIAVRQRAEPL